MDIYDIGSHKCKANLTANAGLYSTSLLLQSAICHQRNCSELIKYVEVENTEVTYTLLEQKHKRHYIDKAYS